MRKKQAEHNEQLCNLLFQKSGYNDWVVTTAFYSCLHYVQHKIFISPLESENKKYAAFELYYKDFSEKHPTICKHKATLNLVWDNLPIIYDRYRWLKDECHNARYKTYDVSDGYAKKAKEHLEKIKLECM